MKRSDPDSLLPLTPSMFQILIALADGEKHGYAIIKEVARRTNGEIALGAGTLYAIIQALRAGGRDRRIIRETGPGARR